ncbi:hypothetical protein BOTBODRAFT_194114 [Botryobasidium botryosum FD-172 SS1]|uniref:Uncharacterized protein n=1 Tax=Botryobasidium botryosum (strain FD-172 SS1) TaxID=930990 RepID=A0A067NAK0_BOTB1|nr:hypothetical protein BOTBODRAFT_194114 [Botryobasidium botryosum FD-172 SS1]
MKTTSTLGKGHSNVQNLVAVTRQLREATWPPICGPSTLANRGETPVPPLYEAEYREQDPSRYHPYDSRPGYDCTHIAGTSTSQGLPAVLSAQAELLSQYSSLIPTISSNNTHQVPVEPTLSTYPSQELLNITPASIPLPFNHPHHPTISNSCAMGFDTGYTVVGGSDCLPPLPSTGLDDPWNAPSTLTTPRMEAPQGREDIPHRPWVE